MAIPPLKSPQPSNCFFRSNDRKPYTQTSYLTNGNEHMSLKINEDPGKTRACKAVGCWCGEPIHCQGNVRCQRSPVPQAKNTACYKILSRSRTNFKWFHSYISLTWVTNNSFLPKTFISEFKHWVMLCMLAVWLSVTEDWFSLCFDETVLRMADRTNYTWVMACLFCTWGCQCIHFILIK